VRLVCEEKGAPYELVEIDIMQGAHKAPDYLARHPFGRVPAFEHDGFALYETSAITRYLDAVLPGTPLTPADPRGAARMQQVVAIVDAYAYGAMISSIVVQRVVMPMVGGTTDEAVIAAALPTAEVSLAALEDLLGGGQFLAGDSLSLADLHLAPVMAYFSATPEGQARLPGHPNLARWWGAISSRPSMVKTQPQLG
jgi:glutathione S-transferase